MILQLRYLSLSNTIYGFYSAVCRWDVHLHQETSWTIFIGHHPDPWRCFNDRTWCKLHLVSILVSVFLDWICACNVLHCVGSIERTWFSDINLVVLFCLFPCSNHLWFWNSPIATCILYELYYKSNVFGCFRIIGMDCMDMNRQVNQFQTVMVPLKKSERQELKWKSIVHQRSPWYTAEGPKTRNKHKVKKKEDKSNQHPSIFWLFPLFSTCTFKSSKIPVLGTTTLQYI